MIRNVTSRMRAVLTVAVAVIFLPTPLSVRAAFFSAGSAQAPMSDAAKFVGTYRLVATEVKDAAGIEWVQNPDFNSVGYITYAATGHMGVHIMPRNRAPFAPGVDVGLARSNPSTGEEAQAALRGYRAYFGSFTINDKDKFVVHHRLGQINPRGVVDAKRFYDFEGDRLVLTPEPRDGSGREQAARRLVWERLPNAPLSVESRKFVGFYKLLYTDRYRERDGQEVFHGERNYERAETSYIIYTPTGHMMVHLMHKERRTQYADVQPTPDEALQAFLTYEGYFGRFTTYENYNPPFIMHNQQGKTRPGRNVDATKRFYQFTENILRLGGKPRLNEVGEMVGGHLYWEKLLPIR